MARWRLDAPHYLPVPGVEWEHSETSRDGKSVRQRFSVPQYLDPRDGADCNYPGEIIVAHAPEEGKRNPYPRDIIFTGEPSPDMTPLDDEAEAITEALRPKWKHPIDTIPGNFSQSMFENFMSQIETLTKANPNAAIPQGPISAGSSVSRDEFEELKRQMAELLAENANLKAAAAPAPSERRV